MSYLQQPTSPLPPTTNISSPPNQNQPTFSTPHDEPWTSSLFLSTHSFLHRTILAIQQERDQLGFAFYDGEEHTLCVASRDLTELSSSGLTLLQKVKALVRPSMIITHSKCADTFMDALAIPVGHTVIPIELVPWHDFALKSSKWKLIQLQQKWLDTHSFSKTDPCASASDMQPIFTTTTTPTTTSTTPSIATSTFHWSDRSMQAEAIVLSKFNHVYSPLTLGCIGALLGFLTKLEEKEEEERPTTTPSDPHDLTDGSTTPWDVTSLTLFHLEDYMHLHPYDLEAFTIFADPASLIQSPACIFDLLNHTRSSDGKYMLRKWLLRPLASKTLIEHRFQVIQFLLLPQHTPLILQCQLALSKIRSLPVIFKKPRMDINDWHALFQFTRAVPKLHEPLHTCQADSVPFLNTLLATMDLPLLHHLFQMMMDVIDFDRSFPQKTCMVKPGLHAGLDEKKKLDAQLPVLLSKVATSLNLPLDPSLQGHLNVLYFPQLGYLISIPSPKVSAIAPRLLDLEFQFRSPSNAFFKNEKMRELDVELGDVRGAIVDLEIEIFQELYEQIKPCQAYLLDLHQKLTEFDCLVSFAEAARKHRFVQPKIVSEPIFEVKNARHPLLEHYTQPYISNDIQSHEDCIQIITGPNASGKSVYLKTIGLITYLAHLGSFVPADEATLGLTDKLFTRMVTKESVARMESAFLIDLQQLSHALRQATKSSLILIDEFGKGTETNDGLGLLSGVLSYFIELSNKTAGPRVFLATHFHELHSHTIIEPNPSVIYLKTQVVQDAENDLVFLFKIVKGHSMDSLGVYCAIQAGIPNEIIERSIQVSDWFEKGIPFQTLPHHPHLDSLSLLTPKIDFFLSDACDLQDPLQLKQVLHPFEVHFQQEE